MCVRCEMLYVMDWGGRGGEVEKILFFICYALAWVCLFWGDLRKNWTLKQ